MLRSRLNAWSSVNLKLAFIFFETTFKEPEREALGNDEVLPCYRSTRTRLPNANSRSCIAVMISLTRAPSGWCVGVHPKTADLPILVAAKSLRTTRIKQWLKPRVE